MAREGRSDGKNWTIVLTEMILSHQIEENVSDVCLQEFGSCTPGYLSLSGQGLLKCYFKTARTRSFGHALLLHGCGLVV